MCNLCRYLRDLSPLDDHFCRYLRDLSPTYQRYDPPRVVDVKFCRQARDPRLRKKRRGAFLSLFTVLQSTMTEIPAIFVAIYATFASMTRDARHFCRQARDPRLRKKRRSSFLSIFA